MKAVIQAEGLTKRYSNGVLALDHLDLSVQAGEVYCLLGANGAGKTTAIGLFFDFHRPTSGRALICGVEVAAQPLEAKRQAAYVAENVLLYGNLTAYQNLDFFARLGGRRDLSKSQASDVLRKVGLQEEAFERKIKTFSKGMRQKLGIAIAMIKDSKAILLDEPTTGLDPKAAGEFLEVVRELQADGKAILVSTHDIFRVEEIATTVGIMNQGRLVREIPASELPRGARDLHHAYMEAVATAQSA